MPKEGKPAAEVVLTKLHAGGKFDNSAYKVSGGLHGVGISVVNALSERLNLEIWRGGKVYVQSYKRGVPTSPLEMTGHTDRRGTKVGFKPDDRIFETTEFSFDIMIRSFTSRAFAKESTFRSRCSTTTATRNRSLRLPTTSTLMKAERT
jgi:DNA gyrase subunit B